MKTALLSIVALTFGSAAFAAEIEVTYAPEFAEALEDDLGAREGDYLAKEIREDLDRELAKAGVDVAKIEVTILKAKPSKPTFQQLGDRPGLDYSQSVSLGGMKMSAEAFDVDGNSLSSLEYGWFENYLEDVALTTWTDAKRASDKFARKLVKELSAS